MATLRSGPHLGSVLFFSNGAMVILPTLPNRNLCSFGLAEPTDSLFLLFHRSLRLGVPNGSGMVVEVHAIHQPPLIQGFGATYMSSIRLHTPQFVPLLPFFFFVAVVLVVSRPKSLQSFKPPLPWHTIPLFLLFPLAFIFPIHTLSLATCCFAPPSVHILSPV